jgi:endonuclease/exonuclease/phosphatase family metal-dependent hydrolase
VLAMGYPYLTKFYSFSEKKILLTDDVKIMSYNVRMFNLYNWINNESVDENIYDFITNTDPDILCIQEFYPDAAIGFKYPYKYVKISNKNKQFGHAIFSKYEIVNSGALNFSNSGNNVIFADIVKNNDTVRIYNAHLESLKINPNKEKLTQENTQKFRLRVENAFKKQANQAILLKNHMNKTTHKTVLCGDFNNTAFSWVYNTLKTNKNDAYEIAGKGFGKTYNAAFPLRIDFILTDKAIEINHFKTFDVPFSDHFPIMAHINF